MAISKLTAPTAFQDGFFFSGGIFNSSAIIRTAPLVFFGTFGALNKQQVARIVSAIHMCITRFSTLMTM